MKMILILPTVIIVLFDLRKSINPKSLKNLPCPSPWCIPVLLILPLMAFPTTEVNPVAIVNTSDVAPNIYSNSTNPNATTTAPKTVAKASATTTVAKTTATTDNFFIRS